MKQCYEFGLDIDFDYLPLIYNQAYRNHQEVKRLGKLKWTCG